MILIISIFFNILFQCLCLPLGNYQTPLMDSQKVPLYAFVDTGKIVQKVVDSLEEPVEAFMNDTFREHAENIMKHKFFELEEKELNDTRSRPVFFASLQKDPYTLSGIDSKLIFDDVKINRANGYNSSTGVFTAPRKGLYHFSCLILGANGHVVHYQINKNDAVYTYGYSTKGVHTASTLSVIMDLKKGDRVYIKHRISTSQRVTGNHHSTFAGYFLNE